MIIKSSKKIYKQKFTNIVKTLEMGGRLKKKLGTKKSSYIEKNNKWHSRGHRVPMVYYRNGGGNAKA